jgi:uncharacterized protein involved in outer membrane biogenesis
MVINRVKKIVLSKPFLIAVGVVAFYTLAGFFLAPWLVRHYVPKIAQERLQKQAAIGEVRFNPYVFTFEAQDFRMQEPDGQPIVGFKRLFLDFELKSLFNWAWTFRQIALEGPQVNAVIAKDGALNLAQLTPPSEKPPTPPEKDEALPPLIVEDFSIDQGRIDFTDRRPSKPAAIEFKPLQLQVNNLTTLPGQEGPNTITASTPKGESMRWSGVIGLNPIHSKGNFVFENFQTATFWEFARDALNLQRPAGKLTVTGDYHADLSGAQPALTLSSLGVAISDVALKLQGTEAAFLELPDTRISGGSFDLSRQQVDVGKIAVKGGHVRLAVDESGNLNLERIAKPAAAAPAPEQAAAAPGAGSEAAKPWTVNLSAFDLNGLAVDYQDLSRTPGLKCRIGGINVDLKAAAQAGGERTQVLVNDIAVAVSEFQAQLSDSAEPVIRTNKIGLEGGAYNLEPNSFTVEKIAIDGGGIDLRRQADGAVNLALVLLPPQEGVIARERQAAAVEGHPFQFSVKTVSVAGLQTAFSDFSVRPDGPIVHLEEIAVVLNDVDGTSPMTFEAGLKIREGGQINATGKIEPSGPAVEAEIQVADLELTAFQPYVTPAAAIDLKSGTFSTKGSLRHGIKSAGAQTAYQGGFKVDNLRVTETGGKETLVGWKVVQTDQLALQLEPNRLEIGDLKVMQPNGKFIIEKDRSLNMARVIKSDPAGAQPEKAPAASADSFPFRVRRILVSDGKVDFADLSLITPFGTKIHELKGVVAGVSSAKNVRAQIKLDGRVDEYGTSKIDGELNSSDPKAFTDISVVFRNVEMSRLTPYSGKFAGRKIDSGKLSVDLKYKIDKSQLKGDNQIVVERLTLGEKVESPDAVDLPLDLAVALLEDPNGVIDLGLPVSGNLDSPEFSFGALIWKALGNLITKIVTSPFRALGALVPGGGEEAFNTVAFEPGRPDVPPPEKEKLAKLAGALQKRPQLKLSVQGRYNPESDRAELRTAAVRQALAVRLGQKPAPGEEPGPVDFGSPETTKALEILFAERLGAEALKAVRAELKAADEKAKKEAAAKGKAAPVESAAEDPGQTAKVLFDRLAAAEPVDDGALVRLGEARTQAVVAELSGPGQIAAERLEAKPSAALDPKDAITAALNLEAGR